MREKAYFGLTGLKTDYEYESILQTHRKKDLTYKRKDKTYKK